MKPALHESPSPEPQRPPTVAVVSVVSEKDIIVHAYAELSTSEPFTSASPAPFPILGEVVYDVIVPALPTPATVMRRSWL